MARLRGGLHERLGCPDQVAWHLPFAGLAGLVASLIEQGHGLLHAAHDGLRHRSQPQRDGVVGTGLEKRGTPRRGLGKLFGCQLQAGAVGHQAGPPRMQLRQPVHLRQRRGILLAFRETFDLFEIAHQFRAAELDLFACAARAGRIGVDGHGWMISGRRAHERVWQCTSRLPSRRVAAWPAGLHTLRFSQAFRGRGQAANTAAERLDVDPLVASHARPSLPVQQPRILIVDPEGSSGLPYAALSARLQPFEVRVEQSLEVAIGMLSRDSWDLGVVTARAGAAADVLHAALKKADPQLPMVVIDTRPNIDTARACLQAGAGDYLDIARAEAELEAALARLLTEARRKAAEEVLRRAVERPYSFDGFLGESPAMRQVYSIIDRIATSSVDVLVTGETGTGKELVARAIHSRSRRNAGPFVPVDCGAIPDALMESELFGHERGAFTGADARRMGLVEFADGGTLFLDEVGELPLPLQAKLLRVLQERRVRRVGARLENAVDVRVIAATSRNVEQMVERGEFRRDLLYRINVVRIDLPPLRLRGDDIGLLAEFFANRAAQEMGRRINGLSTDVYQVLRSYHWPGNVRELQNVVRRAIAMTQSSVAGVDDLPDEVVAAAGRTTAAAGYFAQRAEHVARFENQYLNDLLSRHAGDVSAAARDARLPRGTLYRLMKSHGLDGATFRK